MFRFWVLGFGVPSWFGFRVRGLGFGLQSFIAYLETRCAIYSRMLLKLRLERKVQGQPNWSTARNDMRDGAEDTISTTRVWIGIAMLVT